MKLTEEQVKQQLSLGEQAYYFSKTDKIKAYSKILEQRSNPDKSIIKLRSDKGCKRNKYDNSLPKEYKSYLMRSNVKGVEFSLSQEEFYLIANKDCYYCGEEGMNGIDRINPKLGYFWENCVPCCSQCNHMKFIYSQNSFLKQVEKIHKHQIYIEQENISLQE
jgi:5-methylcytosine-specific restriction endonuclease McrA